MNQSDAIEAHRPAVWAISGLFQFDGTRRILSGYYKPSCNSVMYTHSVVYRCIMYILLRTHDVLLVQLYTVLFLEFLPWGQD